MAKFSVNMISYVLRRTVDLTVVIPTVTIPESLARAQGEEISHQVKDKYPVLYLLHGYGNNHATWQGYARIELFAEERQIAVVMLSAENKFYLDHGGDDNYFEFIEEELPEFITNMFPISTRKEDTYIAGLSMGGFGALVHGLSHPEKYQAIGSFSGAMKMDGASIQPIDLLTQIKKEDVPALYIACGEDDFIYESNKEIIALLDKREIPYTWDSVPNYKHEWRFWDLEVEKYLDWLPRTDPYAAKKRSV